MTRNINSDQEYKFHCQLQCLPIAGHNTAAYFIPHANIRTGFAKKLGVINFSKSIKNVHLQ